ncbi:hypothetical protein N752_27995 [Desulforamulus aquiferis]|nr:hypothetical protein N752_27995 [Desulforamulus aquiferis]
MVSVAIGVLFSSILLHFIFKILLRPIKELVKTTRIIASGNLAVDINAGSKDEVGILADSFKVMLNQMRILIKQIAHKSLEMKNSTNTLRNSSQYTVNKATTTSSTMNQIASTIDTISSNTQEISRVSQHTARQAEKGTGGIDKVSLQMKSIASSTLQLGEVISKVNEKSREINRIVEFITNISEQTNLLALNAAIEAARQVTWEEVSLLSRMRLGN